MIGIVCEDSAGSGCFGPKDEIGGRGEFLAEVHQPVQSVENGLFDGRVEEDVLGLVGLDAEGAEAGGSGAEMEEGACAISDAGADEEKHRHQFDAHCRDRTNRAFLGNASACERKRKIGKENDEGDSVDTEEIGDLD